MIYIDIDKLRCPTCGAPVVRSLAMNMGMSESWVQCSKSDCPTYINTFIPMPHQTAVMKDSSRYILNAGGYGTGKTRGDIEDQMKSSFITPNGRSLLGAPTMPQLNSTLRNDLESVMPLDFIKKVNLQQNTFELINNHEYLYRSFDDPNKLKSLNLTRATIVEASDSPYGAFEQLKTRLRNRHATVQRVENGKKVFREVRDNYGGVRMIPVLDADWRKIILETNPGPGWIKSEVLLKSNRIHYYFPDETFVNYFQNREEIDLNLSSYIIPTKANVYLPPNFEEEQSSGKPNWWRERYFKGSFEYATGLVYPEFKENIVPPFNIPVHWKRIISMDFGVRDQTFFVFLAIDPDNRIGYVYDTMYISDSSIHTISDKYRERLKNFPHNSLLKTPVMDQRSRNRRTEFDVQKTIGDLFKEEGLLFDPAQMNVEARITRTGTLFKKGQLKIFSNQTELIEQLENYKFPELQIGKHIKNYDKPADSEDHGPNALEFAVMELPHNIEYVDLNLYDIATTGELFFNPQNRRRYYNPLSNDRDLEYNEYEILGGMNYDNDIAIDYNDGMSLADLNSLDDSSLWD